MNNSRGANLLGNVWCMVQQQATRYLAKKPATLTDAQIQFQKHTSELGFKEKTSIRGTLFEFHDVETSKKYMTSQAFKEGYGDKLIWQYHIRNFKGRFPKSYTREKCIHLNRYTTGNPCPICKDPYLVVHYTNLELLRHFVSPDTGLLYPTKISNVCRKQHENLEIAFGKACDHGLIEHYVPHRHYDYSVYYANEEEWKKRQDMPKKESTSALLSVVLGAKRNSIHRLREEFKKEHLAE